MVQLRLGGQQVNVAWVVADPSRSAHTMQNTQGRKLNAIYRAYRAQLTAEAEVLIGLLRENDRDGLSRFCHRLAGTAGTYEVMQVSTAALELRAELERGGDLDALGGRIEALVALLREAAREVS